MRIRSFVIQKFPVARKRSIDDNTPLLEYGIIDSLGVLDLVTFLEQSFGIAIADEELTPDHFASITSISVFVDKKRSRSEIAAESIESAASR